MARQINRQSMYNVSFEVKWVDLCYTFKPITKCKNAGLIPANCLSIFINIISTCYDDLDKVAL